MKSTNRPCKSIKIADQLHNERTVFEAYVKQKYPDCDISFNIEKQVSVCATSCNKKCDRSSHFIYANSDVELIWQGWQMAENSNLPINLIKPLKLSRFDAELTSNWGDLCIEYYEHKRGDNISADDLLQFIEQLKSSNVPSSTILNQILNNL